MDAPKTNDAFLREKLNNFANFLEGLIKSRPKDKRTVDAHAKIQELRTIDTAVFLLHITQDMLPYKNNIPAYVSKMLSDDGSSVDELKKDDPNALAKLTRYISLFIELVSES